jgi:hypothetical protein
VMPLRGGRNAQPVSLDHSARPGVKLEPPGSRQSPTWPSLAAGAGDKLDPGSGR